MIYFINFGIILSNINNNIESNWPTRMAGQFFSTVFAFFVVIALAYFTTKLMAKTRFQRNVSSNIKIVESIGVGYQVVIQLIKVGDKYILIGVSKDKVSYLTEIDPESLDFTESGNTINKIPFDKYLKGFLNKNGDNHVDR